MVQRQEALAAVQVARSELERLTCQLGVAQEAADKKGQEIRWVGWVGEHVVAAGRSAQAAVWVMPMVLL